MNRDSWAERAEHLREASAIAARLAYTTRNKGMTKIADSYELMAAGLSMASRGVDELLVAIGGNILPDDISSGS